MKKSILFIIIAFIIVYLSSFAFLLYRGQSVSELLLHVKIDKNASSQHVEAKFSEIDLLRLKHIIETNNKSLKEESLLALYEREREHYIYLTTILLGLMTVLSIYSAFNRLIERDEHNKAIESLNSLEKEIKKEIDFLKKGNIKQQLLSYTLDFERDAVLIMPNQAFISNIDEFRAYVERQIGSISKSINKHDDVVIEDLLFTIYNHILSIMNYANRRKLIVNTDWDASSNVLFLSIAKEFFNNLSDSKYKKLFDALSKLRNGNISFGVFEKRKF
ncbi:hypothetical protein V6Z05_19765 [Leptospira venezuelensis]|uniref:hypothetical protein n=1 Tax=Leptospira venezuelensis TaxID=1958811 RepID=UPI000A3863AE|nr:hypothetical protein [Leptospira venezuelensis]